MCNPFAARKTLPKKERKSHKKKSKKETTTSEIAEDEHQKENDNVHNNEINNEEKNYKFNCLCLLTYLTLMTVYRKLLQRNSDLLRQVKITFLCQIIS